MVWAMSIDATAENAAHLLRRAAWGGTPDEIAQAVSVGIEASVDALLDPTNAPDVGGPYRNQTGEQAFSEASFLLWWFRTAATSPTPAIERLGWFWHGHFATSLDKLEFSDLMHTQMVTMRRNSLGRFDDLVMAILNDAAMNSYLDLHMSQVGNVNENFARELLELFTMGQGQGYTQTDVEQAARALTGYSLVEVSPQYRPLSTEIRQELHDYGDKTFLGATGNFSGGDIVNAIVGTRECHRFIVGRMWHRYAGTTPDETVLNELADVFGQQLLIGDVLAAMLKHQAFYSVEVKQGLVLQPVELLVRAFRSFGLPIVDVSNTPFGELEDTAENTDGGWRPMAVEWLSWEIGQQPGRPPNVSGWGHNEHWLDTNGSSARVRVGREVGYLVAEADNALSESLLGLTSQPRRLAQAVLEQFGVVTWSATTMDALTAAANVEWPPDAVVATVATAFSSPEVTLA